MGTNDGRADWRARYRAEITRLLNEDPECQRHLSDRCKPSCQCDGLRFAQETAALRIHANLYPRKD